jgi:hypothetical protein
MAFGSSNYTLAQPNVISNFKNYFIPDTAGYVMFNQAASKFGYYLKDNANKPFNKEKTMQGVVVKSGGWHNWKNDPIAKMDDKYTNMFKGVGANVTSLDVLHDEMTSSKIDIFNYMVGKVSGLQVIYRNNMKSFSYINPNGLIFYVNEVETEAEDLDRINLDDIAYIKVIDRIAWKPLLPAALCFYLKKGDDLIDRRPKDTDLKSVKIPGYSPVKEFYSPDYSQSNTGLGTDARTTLLWLPYIVTDATTHKIPVTFYNNDFTKRIRITLEGVNDDGKMIHLEKIIE